MKRKICILIIFLFLIALSIIDLLCVNKTFTNMTEKIDALNISIDKNNAEELTNEAKSIEEYWIKSEKRLTLFLYYRDIDTLGKQVDLVCTLIETNDFDEAKIEIKQLQYLLRSVSKVYEFNIDNLL